MPNKEIDDSLIGQYGQAKVSNLNARNLSYRAQNMSMDAKDMHESLHPGSSNNQNASMLDYKDTNDAIVSFKYPHKRINTNDEESFKQAQALVERMKQEKLQKKQKEAERRKRLKERIKREEELLDQRRKAIEEQKELDRQQRLEQIKLKEQQRKMKIENNEKIYKQNLKKIEKNTLYKQIEKRFEHDYVIPELERRKQELAAKRNFAKPIDKEGILEHEKKYEELLKQEEAKRHEKYKYESDYDPNRYKSKFMDKIIKDEEQNKAQKDHKVEELSKLIKKKENYSKLVLETHKPTISKRKKMEMELIKQNLDNPTAFERMKKRMVSSSQNKIASVSNLNKSQDSSLSSARQHTSTKPKYKDFDWREKNRFMNIPKPEHNFKKRDYLVEKRNEKANQSETRSEYRKHINWEDEIKKLEGDDRVNLVKEKARILEREAMKREQLMKVNSSDQTSDRNEINDMIIDSIKAKIALLDNID